MRFYKLAAEQGVSEAQFALAAMYRYGEAGAPDSTEAARWYRRAAEQGLPEAQLYQWLHLAAAAGDGNAVTGKERVAARLSAEQVTRAQAWAAAWKPCGTPEECGARLKP